MQNNQEPIRVLAEKMAKIAYPKHFETYFNNSVDAAFHGQETEHLISEFLPLAKGLYENKAALSKIVSILDNELDNYCFLHDWTPAEKCSSQCEACKQIQNPTLETL